MNPAGPRLQFAERLKLAPVLRPLENINVRFRVGSGLIALQFLSHHAVVKFRFHRDRRGHVTLNEVVDEMFGFAVFPLFGMDRERFFTEWIGIALGQLRKLDFRQRIKPGKRLILRHRWQDRGRDDKKRADKCRWHVCTEKLVACERVNVVSGEHRLLACSFRQLAEKLFARAMSPASCRRRQASSLCSPELLDYTRERRRPELRVYFTGRRFGSILVMPAPLFTSMIWSRRRAARSNSKLAEARCISSSSSRNSSVTLKSPPASRMTDDSISRPRRIVCKLSCTARRTVCGVIPCASLYSICFTRRYSEIDMSASMLCVT